MQIGRVSTGVFALWMAVIGWNETTRADPHRPAPTAHNPPGGPRDGIAGSSVGKTGARTGLGGPAIKPGALGTVTARPRH